jgi:hypothetical protein
MTHSKWVALFERFGVFANVYAKLGLSTEERRLVGWRSEPLRYFYRNQFVATHWQYVRIMEEHPNLKVLVLSLSELVAAAVMAQEKRLAIGLSECLPSSPVVNGAGELYSVIGAFVLEHLAATDRLHGDPGFAHGATGFGYNPPDGVTMGPFQKSQTTSGRTTRHVGYAKFINARGGSKRYSVGSRRSAGCASSNCAARRT